MLNRLFYLLNVVILFFGIGLSIKTEGQCPGSYTQAQLNWNFRDFIVSTGNYSGFVSAARAATQRFTIGTTGVEIAYTGAITNNGEDATHTADAGQDLNFDAVPSSGDVATITLTFDTEVVNLNFSIYDVDRRQRVSVNGKNALAVDVNTTLTRRSGTVLTITGSPGFTPLATAANTNVSNASNDGTVDVAIAGPVKIVTLSISNTNSVSSTELFLSSITACVTGSFPGSYRNISRPFTGMPGYILTVRDNEVYQLDPATGIAKHLFTDPGWTNLNGMAYDPYKRILYYTYSLRNAAPGGNAGTKTLFKYDLDTETISTFIADVNAAPLFLPTYDPGVTSAAASFFNGSLYFGIESSNSARTSGRENTVWRIDFAADSITPILASQVYATRVDSNIAGTNRLIHDWSDIGVTNDMLYDFDGARGDSMYYHFNMMTGQRTEFLPSGAGNIGPKQTAIDWQENVYNMGGLPTGTPLTIGGYIVPYNYDGTLNNAQNQLVSVLPGPTYPTGSWGDCSEAFRPTCDFGDAPATYDPDTWSPAVHERDTALRIGATWDREWLKRGVTGVEDIDDGLVYVPILAKITGGYFAQVSVWNNTGADATLCAWLDYNGNDVFDIGEGIAPITISSMPSMQTPYIVWTGITTPISNGSFTYLRIRLTSASNGMTAANPTGYFNDGETEDYRVLVDDFPLKADLLNFTAKAINEKNVELDWTSNGEENFKGYEVQRSADNINWSPLTFLNAKGNGIATDIFYVHNDRSPLSGKSYYRLKLVSNDDKNKYSDVRVITIRKDIEQVTLFPNPATNKAGVLINATIDAMAFINIIDINGRSLYNQKSAIRKGLNNLDIPAINTFNSGIYIVQVEINGEFFVKKLIVN